MITIVDYGMGNLGSILNMFKRIGVAAEITGDLDALGKARKLLLPGVGAFDSAMSRINESGIRDVLDRKALQERIPVLGICLGMQLLTRSSDEGRLPGLGWIGASTQRFPPADGLKVPHMGWNIATAVQPHPLLGDLQEDARFYFVHSYFVKVDDPRDALLKTTHGVTFDAAVSRGNIHGAQFHPEKSHKFGMRFLANFARL
jgi:imidazole glycerol-phosphate synthase subunit HisH